MLEKQKEQEFLEILLTEVNEKMFEKASYQIAFLEKILEYLEPETDPEILNPAYINSNKNILVNAYSINEDGKSLDMYVVDYHSDQDNESLLSINMSELIATANQIKRFITNVEEIIQVVDKSQQTFELANIIVNNPIDTINIYIMTNRYYNSNKQVEIKIPKYKNVNVHVWDIERVYQIHSAELGAEIAYINFEKQFGETFEMMFVPDPLNGGVKDNFDCYIGFIPATLLAKVYDFWGPKLVERNVRSFLQARGATNKGIRDTLKNPNEKQMFVAYNNGISSVATNGDIEKISEGVNLFKINGLHGWQIVNGGQTTASIHRAYKDGVNLNDVFVQAKLTILQVDSDNEKDKHLMEDEMVARISEYANTQNKINKSDLLANTRFMSEIESLSRNTWIPSQDGRKADTKWYFERARGQYLVDVNRRKKGKEQNDFKKQNPSSLVISKVDLAKFTMAWYGFPHISSKGGEAAFKAFMDYYEIYWKTDLDSNEERKSLSTGKYKDFVALIIITKKITEIVSNMKLKGYRANVIYYTSAIFSETFKDDIKLIEVWEKQNLSSVWDDVIRLTAENTLNYLRVSAEDRNVTQWAKQEGCWVKYKKEYSHLVKNFR